MRPSGAAVVGIWVIAACSIDTQNALTSDTVMSQGIVVGVVRDTAGHPVANALVCATATFSSGGTPTIASTLGKSVSGGGYVVPLNLTYPVDAQAHLTVAATPDPGSGLQAGSTGGLIMAITSSLPPAETTHADIAVVSGTPYHGVFCTAGP